MEKMIAFAVNEPFPGPVPATEGATMELQKSGLIVFIQMPGLTRPEKQAFRKSFKHYAYLETDTPIPLAMWVFDFPGPHGPVDCNFNGRLVDPAYIRDFMALENGQVKNLLTFYLLDGRLLKGIKTFGLHPEAVTLFHATIRKQLGMDYSEAEYNKYLNAIYQFGPEELMSMGKKFKTKKG